MLHQRRLTTHAVNELINLPSTDPVALDDEQRDALARRFRSVTVMSRRRLDAWSVERAGERDNDFAWSARTSRRAIGHGALRRWRHEPTLSVTAAVREEMDELLVRAATGYARAGSLPCWLADQSRVALGVVTAEAVRWVSDALEVLETLPVSWVVPSADAFYDIAGAQTSLRARRDVIVETESGRILLRFRGGQPGKSAGPGLRSDLVIDALSDPSGTIARRVIGLWPDAGLALAVDGTLDDARLGARDLVRTAVVQARRDQKIAA